MTYDQKCYDLGKSFLEDEKEINNEQNRGRLAQLIQNTIEDFILELQEPKSNLEFPHTCPDEPCWCEEYNARLLIQESFK